MREKDGGPTIEVEPQNTSEGLTKLINEVEESCSQLIGLVDSFREQIKSGQLDTSDGINLLDVKNHMMLSYLANCAYIIARKCNGDSIEGDAAIERLVEIRTVLERIRPLEHKLKYMMDKLVKTALTGVTDSNDPTHFRANPNNMLDDDNEDSSSGSEDDKEQTAGKKAEKKPGVYVPPRLAPMHYDQEESLATRKQKMVERAKKRALDSSVIQELREEYLDTPTEVTHGNALRATQSRHQWLKDQYEEEYFTRLPTTKKDKHRSRHSMTVGNIGDHLTHFENIQVLEDDSTVLGQKKRKSKGSGKAKKSFKRRKTR